MMMRHTVMKALVAVLLVSGSQAQAQQSGPLGVAPVTTATTPPADTSTGTGGVWRIPVSELENALSQLNAETATAATPASPTTADLQEALASISEDDSSSATSTTTANPDGPIASTLGQFPAFDSSSSDPELVSDDDDGNSYTDDDDEIVPGSAATQQEEEQPAASGGGAVSTTTAAPAVSTGIKWNQPYTMDFTSVMREETSVLQAFGPGLVPMPEDNMKMKDLRANFDYKTNVTYPLRVTTGFLMNGTRAGTINIGLKDLVTQLKNMGGSSNEFQALVRDSNLPILVSVEELVMVPLEEFPEYMSYQVVCTDWQTTYLNLLDPVKQECLNKPTEIKINLIPEFAFLQRLICMDVPPVVAWAEQCQGWSEGFVSTGSDCVWDSPRNVTIADTETDLAKIVDSRLEISMLSPPMSDQEQQHEIPIQMTVELEMVEEFLNIVSNQRFPSGQISPNFPGVNNNLQFPFNGGRKLMQVAAPGPADMVGVIMDRRVETTLIPHKPVEQLTLAEGQALVSIC
jgi:hypothetical protein